ncbi:MAG: hypothetical protein ABJK28_14820 [Algibacter sp.]
MYKRLSKKYFAAYLALYILMGFVVVIKGPIYLPDSYAHLDMLINRSPVYSLFLKIFTSLFGNYYQTPLLLTQYLLLIFSIDFLLKTLCKRIDLLSISVLAFQFTLLANAVYWFASVNKILSESITFPLLLILLTYLFKSFTDKTFKPLYKAIMVLVLLQFTRGQFIAFLPILLAVAIFLIFKTKAYRKGVLAILLVLFVPFIINYSEKAYNKAVHGHYKNYAMTYVHFISNPFYIAKRTDVEIFENEEEKAFFSRTFEMLESKKITRDYALSINNDDYAFYESNFTKICNASIHEANMSYYAKRGFKTEHDQQYKVDDMTTKMFLPLLKANYKVWLKMVFKSFEKGLGGRQGTFLTFLILIYSLVFVFKDNRFAFLALAILLKLANGLLIAMVVHSITRYTFYLDWIVCTAIIFFMNPILKKYFNVS